MRFLLKLKLFVLIAIWSAICLGLYVALALVEAVAEIGLGAAGATIGQGAAATNLVDLGGDILQWGVGIVWLIGVLVLWYVKRLLTSRETRAQAGRYAVKAATVAAPYVIDRHPVGRAVNMARGPGGKLLGAILARKLGKR